MTDRDHVVALYTFGSFTDWLTDPVTRSEALDYVANPLKVGAPRPQDALVIFELVEVQR